MNFNFPRMGRNPRSCSRFNPLNVLRTSSSTRFWDYLLEPFWDELNVGIAQDSVLSFTPNANIVIPITSNNSIRGDISTRTSVSTSQSTMSIPIVNASWTETPTTHVFKVDVPGLRKEDLAILVEGASLQISGQRQLEHIPANVNEVLRWQAPFVRRFRLPPTAIMERINAVLDHGVLTLTIPKLQIRTSVAWFVPINNQSLRIDTRPWNEQEQSQPDSHQPDTTKIELGRFPPPESAVQENTNTSTVSTQNVSLKERVLNPLHNTEDSSSRPRSLSHVTAEEYGTGPRERVLNPLQNTEESSLASGSSRPRSVSHVTAEAYGMGPNARVTLNINLNTGKISVGDPSSSSSSSSSNPFDHNEDRQNYSIDVAHASIRPTPSSSRASSRSSVSKRKSSVGRVEDHEDEDFDPSLSPGPSSSYKTPSSPILRKKSSMVQVEDPEDDGHDLDPSPGPSSRSASPSREPSPVATTRKGSELKIFEKFKGRNLGRRQTTGGVPQVSSNRSSPANRRKTVGDEPVNIEKFSESDMSEEANAERPVSVRKSQVKQKFEGDFIPESVAEQLEPRNSLKPKKRASAQLQRRKTPGDLPKYTEEKLESRRGSARKDSPVEDGQSSKVLNVVEKRASARSDPALSERDESNESGRRASERKSSSTQKRQKSTSSTKRGSTLESDKPASKRKSSSDVDKVGQAKKSSLVKRRSKSGDDDGESSSSAISDGRELQDDEQAQPRRTNPRSSLSRKSRENLEDDYKADTDQEEEEAQEEEEKEEEEEEEEG